jgi:transcriptional regulator
VVAHVYGRLIPHDDPAWTSDLVRRLTDRHEASRQPRWSVDDAPPAYIKGQLRAIVGIEIAISRIEAKWKLSQNRSAEDVAGVIEDLRSPARGSDAELAVAAAMEIRQVP